MIEKLTKASPLYDQAYNSILKMILNERFEPNEKLTDAGLAGILGISRTPAREAVRQLVRDGLLVGSPNRSVTVFQPTIKDIAELYSIRSVLEGYAARLAFLNPQKLLYVNEMKECLVFAKEAAAKSDATQSALMNTKFHNLIIEASMNQNLITLFPKIKNKSLICRLTSLKYEVRTNIALNEHFQILDEITDGNENNCEKLMKRHVLQAGLRILSQLSIKFDEEQDPIFLMYYNQFKDQIN